MFRLARRVQARLPGNPAIERRPPRRLRGSRLRLERLENRCLLASFVCTGKKDSTWQDAANWTPLGTGTYPQAGDSASFLKTAVVNSPNVVVGTDRTLAQLFVAADFPGTMSPPITVTVIPAT
jgi:hypothetical protein